MITSKNGCKFIGVIGSILLVVVVSMDKDKREWDRCLENAESPGQYVVRVVGVGDVFVGGVGVVVVSGVVVVGVVGVCLRQLRIRRRPRWLGMYSAGLGQSGIGLRSV